MQGPRCPRGNSPAFRRGNLGSRLFDDFVAEFLNHGIGEHLAGQLLDLLLRGFTRSAVQTEDEKLALANVPDHFESKGGERMLNRLPLRVEDCAFRHDPDVCFHGEGIIPIQAWRCWSETLRGRRVFLQREGRNAGSWPPRSGEVPRMSVPCRGRGYTRGSAWSRTLRGRRLRWSPVRPGETIAPAGAGRTQRRRCRAGAPGPRCEGCWSGNPPEECRVPPENPSVARRASRRFRDRS